MINNTSQLKRLANKTLKDAKRSNDFSKIIKSIDAVLKINKQERIFQASVDNLAQIKITDIPIEILEKWTSELQKIIGKQQLSAEQIAIMLQKPPPPI